MPRKPSHGTLSVHYWKFDSVVPVSFFDIFRLMVRAFAGIGRFIACIRYFLAWLLWFSFRQRGLSLRKITWRKCSMVHQYPMAKVMSL